MEGLPNVHGIVVAKPENLDGVHPPPNVEVRLDVSPTEVRELYAGAACVVVPIRSEAAPVGTENSGTIALLEAMATARPVVVSERSYLADYVEDGETALTVPPEQPSALRAAVERILADDDEADRLATAAQRAVRPSFTTRRFAEQLAEVIRR
jgi:glycosyltransferase involved in cell wall biosynthesis